MIPIINTNIHLRPEIWRIWRMRPKNLTSAMVSLHESSLNFDFDGWKALQVSMLDNILTLMSRGTVTIYDQEAVSEIEKSGLRRLSQKRFYDIHWLQWLPIVSRRRSYLLLNRQDLCNLVESSAWVEYSGTFLIFSSEIDDDLITRFVRQKWVDQDRFIAITVTTDYPSWVVVTNYLDQKNLSELLGASTAHTG